MKKILITGANSYIGTSFENWLEKYPDKYVVETIDIKESLWKDKDFSTYDVVFHVAGIAHIKETKKNASLYYEVNEQLAVAIAEKSKTDGVSQFIILSSMSVYGKTTGHVTKVTRPNPNNNYGKSKYNAAQKIEKMNCDTFKVAILRPPMVYGKDCKGNYQILRKLALKSPVFPSFKNERSMIYIGNLASFIKRLIDMESDGLFFPQDAEYIMTAKMVEMIASCNKKKIIITSIFNWTIKLAILLNIEVFKKVFGNLTYEKCDIVNTCIFESCICETEE